MPFVIQHTPIAAAMQLGQMEGRGVASRYAADYAQRQRAMNDSIVARMMDARVRQRAIEADLRKTQIQDALDRDRMALSAELGRRNASLDEARFGLNREQLERDWDYRNRALDRQGEQLEIDRAYKQSLMRQGDMRAGYLEQQMMGQVKAQEIQQARVQLRAIEKEIETLQEKRESLTTLGNGIPKMLSDEEADVVKQIDSSINQLMAERRKIGNLASQPTPASSAVGGIGGGSNSPSNQDLINFLMGEFGKYQ